MFKKEMAKSQVISSKLIVLQKCNAFPSIFNIVDV